MQIYQLNNLCVMISVLDKQSGCLRIMFLTTVWEYNNDKIDATW